MAPILIVGKGGFGDLFPLFALAQALKTQGHTITVAAEAHHAPACLALGLPLVPLGSRLSSYVGLRQKWAEFQDTLAPDALAADVATLMPLAQEADLIIGNQLAYAGSLVSKKCAKPWVFCAASPLAMPSYQDPPLLPYIHRWQAWTTARGWSQTPYVDLMRGLTRLSMGGQRRLSRHLGLMAEGHPRFEFMYSSELNVLAISPLLMDPPADWPAATRLTGFTWFEPHFLGCEEQVRQLSDYEQAGSPPVIFAPGGSLRTHPGQFFEESLQACEALGIRAIIVAAQRFHASIRPSPQVLVTSYYPYSKLFQGARAVVHSGGIGTLGWCLRFGVPSLLVPSGWDQYDNARRAEGRHLARVLPARAYRATQIAVALQSLLADQALHDNLRLVAPLIAREDGAFSAAQAVAEVLARHGC